MYQQLVSKAHSPVSPSILSEGSQSGASTQSSQLLVRGGEKIYWNVLESTESREASNQTPERLL